VSRRIRTVLKLAVTAVVTVFVLRAVGFSLEQLAALDPATWQWSTLPLTGSVVLLVLGYFLSAALWGRMVAELGGPTLTARESVRIFMVANLGRYVPGKIWQIAGLAALGARRGIPPTIGTAAAVLGQLIAIAGATVVGLGVFFGPNEAWRVWGEIGLIGAIAVFLLISIPATLDVIIGLLFRFTDGEPPKTRIGRSTFGVRWMFFYIANWGIYAAAFWLLYLGLQPFEPFMRVGPAFAAAYVIGYIALFAPAGGGIREGFLVVFLTPVTTPALGAALAVVARAWTTVVELAPAGYFWLTEDSPGQDASETGASGENGSGRRTEERDIVDG